MTTDHEHRCDPTGNWCCEEHERSWRQANPRLAEAVDEIRRVSPPNPEPAKTGYSDLVASMVRVAVDAGAERYFGGQLRVTELVDSEIVIIHDAHPEKQWRLTVTEEDR